MAESGLDVAACLVRVRQRNEDAARVLVEHLYPLVIKIVRAHRPSRLDETDLAQEIFMKMFANLEQYRGVVPFEHWVSRVAVTTCLDRLRAQKRRPVRFSAPQRGQERSGIVEMCPCVIGQRQSTSARQAPEARAATCRAQRA